MIEKVKKKFLDRIPMNGVTKKYFLAGSIPPCVEICGNHMRCVFGAFNFPYLSIPMQCECDNLRKMIYVLENDLEHRWEDGIKEWEKQNGNA